MPVTTIYIVQPFTRRGRRLVPGTQVKLPTAEDARRRAERLSTMTGTVGAVAMSITGDMEIGDVDPPIILSRFGETPDPD